jgi:hypothetical protein
MYLVVFRRPLTVEARDRAPVSRCGVCGQQSGTGAGFPPSSSVFPVSVISPWLFILIYHLGDER